MAGPANLFFGDLEVESDNWDLTRPLNNLDVISTNLNGLLSSEMFPSGIVTGICIIQDDENTKNVFPPLSAYEPGNKISGVVPAVFLGHVLNIDKDNDIYQVNTNFPVSAHVTLDVEYYNTDEFNNFKYNLVDYNTSMINDISNSLSKAQFNRVVKIQPVNSLGEKALYKENPLYGMNLHKTPVFYTDSSLNESERTWMILEYIDEYEEPPPWKYDLLSELSLEEFYKKYKKHNEKFSKTKIASTNYLKKSEETLNKLKMVENNSTTKYRMQKMYFVYFIENTFFIKAEELVNEFEYKIFGPVYYIEECYNFINNYTLINGLAIKQMDDYTFVVEE